MLKRKQTAAPDRAAERAERLRQAMHLQMEAAMRPGIQQAVMRRVDEALQPPPQARPVKLKAKIPDRKQQNIRDSARDEECQARIAGVCNYRTDTTVWSHWPGLDAGRGMALKALDICGAYTCHACHDCIDGRAPLPPGATRESVLLDWHAAHMRSLVILKQKGLV